MTRRESKTHESRDPGAPRPLFTPAQLLELYEAIIARPVRTRAEREAEERERAQGKGAPHE